ncbi:MAG: nitronate monooxygenase, partial [Alphaproteobacteria bacterium]|nr:nitronate monooxygenase [Alphaproteobacteria bacterium]
MARAEAFCKTFDLRVPILLAPMAGACPPALSIAVGRAGGMGACGALLMQPDAIRKWASDVRAGTNGAFQMNIWIPDPEPARDPANEAAVRKFLEKWGPAVSPDAAERKLVDFDAQCDAMIEAGPHVISSIMGLFPDDILERIKAANIKWFATVTTVAEAVAAEAAGADVVIAQGMEAGGHRGAFNAGDAATGMVGLFALVPAVADAVKVPVVAAGGIADGRGIAAALTLGASAVVIGTGLLRTPEAGIAPAWAKAIGEANPEQTIATRAFSGRLGRSIRNPYAVEAGMQDAPEPAPYPIQRALTQAMRDEAAREDDIERMQAWAGQSARLARAELAADVVTGSWDEA